MVAAPPIDVRGVESLFEFKHPTAVDRQGVSRDRLDPWVSPHSTNLAAVGSRARAGGQSAWRSSRHDGIEPSLRKTGGFERDAFLRLGHARRHQFDWLTNTAQRSSSAGLIKRISTIDWKSCASSSKPNVTRTLMRNWTRCCEDSPERRSCGPS